MNAKVSNVGGRSSPSPRNVRNRQNAAPWPSSAYPVRTKRERERMRAYGLWLACALAVLLVSAATAQQSPEADDNDRIAILFDIGMQALDYDRNVASLRIVRQF